MHSEMICVACLRKGKRRLYLSTASDVPVKPERYRPNASAEWLTVPSIVPLYNRRMWTVDCSNQYAAKDKPHRRSKRWWLSIVLHYFHVAVVNAYLLYSKFGHESLPNVDFPQFRKRLANELVAGFDAGRKKIGRQSIQPKGLHTHVQSDVNPGSDRRIKGRCSQCVTNEGQRGAQVQSGHQTTWYCAECTAAHDSTKKKVWVCIKDPKCWIDHCRSSPSS